MNELFGNLMAPPRRLTFRQWQIREGDVLYRASVKHISNTSLLAHLIRDYDASEKLMRHFGNLSSIADASVSELTKVKGIGVSTAERIKVAFELSRRLYHANNETKPQVASHKEIYLLLRDEFFGLKQEVLKVMLLNTKNRVERIQTIFVGTLNCSLMHPRDVFREAIRQSAASIVLAHNHPSGMVDPSPEDVRATKQIQKASFLLQIPLLDHLIIGNDGYCSLKEEGLL